MGLSPLTFSGVSSYSADFQTILQRVVTIASFPLTQLKNEQADVASRRQLTSELNSSVKLLGDKLKALGEVADLRGVNATSSNTSKLSIDSVNSDILTTYNITEVTSTAKAASETSIASYASSTTTQVSASGNMRLKVGDSTFNFSLAPDKNNLVGLRDRINSLGAGVTASILTVDGNTNYLSVTANASGAKELSLREDPDGANTSVLTAANQGSDLSFKLNGVPVTRSTNSVNDLVPGVAFTIKNTTDANETLSISLSSDKNKLSSAISGFVDAYNAVQQKVTAQVGENAGLLSGDYLVRETQDILRRVSSFSLSSGSVKALSDVGVTFSSTGAIAFDFTEFNSLSQSKIQDAFTFFASEDGFASLEDRTANFTEAVTGLADLQLAQYDRTDIRLEEQIAKLEDRINIMQQSYQAKLQQADALLASYDSQKNIITASVDSLKLVLFGKSDA